MAAITLYLAVVVVTTLSRTNALSQVSGYAVVAVSTSNGSSVDKLICAGTSNHWNGSIPTLSRPQYWQPVALPKGRNNPYGCHPNDSTPVSGTDAMVLRRGKCSFDKKALTASSLGANLTVVVNSDDTLFAPSPGNVTTPLHQMEVILISYQDGNWLWNQANSSHLSSLRVTVYVPLANMALRFVPSATVIWIIALTIIIAGSLIAQSSAEFLIYGLVWRKGEVPDDVINPKDVDMKKWQSVIFAIAVVAVLVVFILLLYFFWHVMKFRYLEKIPILKYRPDPKFFITLAVCTCVAVWWAVVRNTSYGWMLLLVLAYAINIRILKVWGKLRRLWVVAVLMCVLFFYDIFMVFITPLFTGDNTSVMEKIALGGESNEIGDPTCETLPITVRVPVFVKDDLSKVCADYISCLSGYVILGFGDIAIPGILVSFCLYVDKTYHPKRKFKVYFCTAVIGYGVGLIVTFVALALAQTAQPALLYLVPFTLIPTLICALAHRELKKLLLGPKQGEAKTQGEQGGGGEETVVGGTMVSMSVNAQEEEEEEEEEGVHGVESTEKEHLLEEPATLNS